MTTHANMQDPLVAGVSSKTRTEPHQRAVQIPQYSLRNISRFGQRRALPMGLLG
jgi:hypothetical protein